MSAITSSQVAEEYDYGMRHPLLDEYYGYSGFFNYGYWSGGTVTQQEACVNLVDKLIAFIPQKRGLILDVACGLGATSNYLQNYFDSRQIIATNISVEQMKIGQRKYPEINFGAMDAVALAFPDAAFDSIICVEAAFHFDPRTAFIEEAFRVLKPNGQLVLSDILFLTLPGGRRRRLPVENSVKSLEQYEELYRQAGFSEVKVIDATAPCWGGFSQNLRKWGWDKLTFCN